MKVNIDRDGCIECAVCESSCEQVFQLPNGEKATIVEKYRKEGKPESGEVPPELEACAQEAADSCPVSVITIEK